MFSHGSSNNTDGFLSYPRTELAAPKVLCFFPLYYQRFLNSGQELLAALPEGESPQEIWRRKCMDSVHQKTRGFGGWLGLHQSPWSSKNPNCLWWGVCSCAVHHILLTAMRHICAVIPDLRMFCNTRTFGHFYCYGYYSCKLRPGLSFTRRNGCTSRTWSSSFF